MRFESPGSGARLPGGWFSIANVPVAPRSLQGGGRAGAFPLKTANREVGAAWGAADRRPPTATTGISRAADAPFLLTESGLVFYETARTLLNGIFGDAVPAVAEAGSAAGGRIASADARMLTRVQEMFPAARLVFYNPPVDAGGFHRFRLKQPCEMHPNGSTHVHLEVGGGLVDPSDACAVPPGERAVHAMYPLHAGKTDSAIYKLLVFLGGLALAILSISGLVTYTQKLRSLLAGQR
jgi:hypothetical protein